MLDHAATIFLSSTLNLQRQMSEGYCFEKQNALLKNVKKIPVKDSSKLNCQDKTDTGIFQDIGNKFCNPPYDYILK